jgi:hypothetical protein
MMQILPCFSPISKYLDNQDTLAKGQLAMLILSLVAGIVVGGAIAAFATPRTVEYVETIVIKGNITEVFDAIRFQGRLMQWSAWPSQTGSTCNVECDDGKIGAKTVFFDKTGQRFGHQEVTTLLNGTTVSMILKSKGPPQKPELHFHLAALDDDTTQVILYFHNAIMPPLNVLLRVFGVVKWTREMHQRDLDGLKRFVEQGVRYTGEPASLA